MANKTYLAGTKFLAQEAVGDGGNKEGKLSWERWTAYCKKVKFEPEGSPPGCVPAVYINGWLWELFKTDSIRSWDTYKGQISGLKREMARRYISTDVWEKREVTTTLQGLRKVIGKYNLAPPPKYRASCTPSLLRSVLPLWDTSTLVGRNSKRLALVCNARALRLGEVAKTKNNKGRVPGRKDINMIGETDLNLFLKCSKGDKWFKGTNVRITAMKDDPKMCPVRAVAECLAECHRYNNRNKPLFCDGNGNAISDYQVMKELHKALLKAGIDTEGFTTKTFRRGKALQTWNHDSNVQGLKDLGRWASDSWKTYIEIDKKGPKENRASFQALLRSIVKQVEEKA